jgi:predicted amino acid dehydrogenase
MVKQFSPSICHDNSSSYYRRKKNYTAYESITAFIDADGRLPRSAIRRIDKATSAVINQGRDLVNRTIDTNGRTGVVKIKIVKILDTNCCLRHLVQKLYIK